MKPNFQSNFEPNFAQKFDQNIPTTVQNYKRPTNTNFVDYGAQNVQNTYPQYPSQNIGAQYHFGTQNTAQHYQTISSYHMNINFDSKNPFLSENPSRAQNASSINYNIPTDYTPNIPIEAQNECSKNVSSTKIYNFAPENENYASSCYEVQNGANLNILSSSKNHHNICTQQNEIYDTDQFYGEQKFEGSKFLSGLKAEDFGSYEVSNGVYDKAQNESPLNFFSTYLLDSNLGQDTTQNIISESDDSDTSDVSVLLNQTSVLIASFGELPLLKITDSEEQSLQNIPNVVVTSPEDYRVRHSISTESSISNLESPDSYHNNWIPSPSSIHSSYWSSSPESSNIPSSSSSSPVWDPTYLDRYN